MLGEDISSTYPSQNMPPLISVSNLLRKLITGDVLVTATPALSRTLSLIPSWSGQSASFGGLYGITFETTHPLPSGFTVQPGGKAGGITLSKFSKQVAAEGLGLADGVGVGVHP